ncbi:MAG: hypothetical protein U0996_13305 [Planctomycetaceae bacterium]
MTDRLRITMLQMDKLIRALEDLKQTVLPNNPKLFAMMSEAPLDDLNRLRLELSGYVEELKPAG